MPRPWRNGPANLLVCTGEAHLIDTGDGAMTQMADAGAEPRCQALGIILARLT